MLIMNILPPKESKEPTKVIYLETLSKGNILKILEEATFYPDRHILATAEATKSLQAVDVAPKDMVTLGEYLDDRGIELETKGDYHKLATLVAQAYTKKYKIRPRIVCRADSRGRFMKKSYAYVPEDLDLVESALKSITHKRVSTNKQR
jgi:hypothetical protein